MFHLWFCLYRLYLCTYISLCSTRGIDIRFLSGYSEQMITPNEETVYTGTQETLNWNLYLDGNVVFIMCLLINAQCLPHRWLGMLMHTIYLF